jgi:hypothetical protein
MEYFLKFRQTSSSIKLAWYIFITTILLLILIQSFWPSSTKYKKIEKENKGIVVVKDDNSPGNLRKKDASISSNEAQREKLPNASISLTTSQAELDSESDSIPNLGSSLSRSPKIKTESSNQYNAPLNTKSFQLATKGTTAWRKQLLDMTIIQSDKISKMISAEKNLGKRSSKELDEAETALHQMKLLEQSLQELIID